MIQTTDTSTSAVTHAPAESEEEATLLPMLIVGLVLTVIGSLAIMVFV